MAIGIQVTFDCADVDRLARFWAEALDYMLQPPPPGYASWDAFADDVGIPPDQRDSMGAVIDPDGLGPRLFFQKVPEPKTAKNRVHLDVNVGGGEDVPLEERQRRVDAKAEVLLAAGASRIGGGEVVRGEYHIVMADPEGNEFCLQ